MRERRKTNMERPKLIEIEWHGSETTSTNVRRICCTCVFWRKYLSSDEVGHCVAADGVADPIVTDAYTQCGLWIANTAARARLDAARTAYRAVLLSAQHPPLWTLAERKAEAEAWARLDAAYRAWRKESKKEAARSTPVSPPVSGGNAQPVSGPKESHNFSVDSGDGRV